MNALPLALWCCGIWLCVLGLGIGGSLLWVDRQWRARRRRAVGAMTGACTMPDLEPTLTKLGMFEPLDFERVYRNLAAARKDHQSVVDDLLDGRITLEAYVKSLGDEYERAARCQADRLDRELDLRLRRKQMRRVR